MNSIKVRLGEIVNITMGQSPKSEFYNTNGNGLPFLQGNRTFGFKYPRYDTYSTVTPRIGFPGEVIMSVRAPVGEINLLEKKTCLGRGVCTLSLKDKSVAPDFLYYALKANVKHIKGKQSGTVFGSINKTDLENIVIEVPKKQNWNKVATALGNIDNKILTNNQINKNLLDFNFTC